MYILVNNTIQVKHFRFKNKEITPPLGVFYSETGIVVDSPSLIIKRGDQRTIIIMDNKLKKQVGEVSVFNNTRPGLLRDHIFEKLGEMIYNANNTVEETDIIQLAETVNNAINSSIPYMEEKYYYEVDDEISLDKVIDKIWK